MHDDLVERVLTANAPEGQSRYRREGVVRVRKTASQTADPASSRRDVSGWIHGTRNVCKNANPPKQRRPWWRRPNPRWSPLPPAVAPGPRPLRTTRPGTDRRSLRRSVLRVPAVIPPDRRSRRRTAHLAARASTTGLRSPSGSANYRPTSRLRDRMHGTAGPQVPRSGPRCQRSSALAVRSGTESGAVHAIRAATRRSNAAIRSRLSHNLKLQSLRTSCNCVVVRTFSWCRGRAVHACAGSRRIVGGAQNLRML